MSFYRARPFVGAVPFGSGKTRWLWVNAMNQRLHCNPGFRVGGDSPGAAVLKRNRPSLAVVYVLASRPGLAEGPDGTSGPGGV